MTATLIENICVYVYVYMCIENRCLQFYLRFRKKKKKVQSVNKLIPMELQNGDERNDGRFEEYTYIEFLYRLE